MECPGMSLFQGAGSILINNSAQARLEEERFEDQKRRNEELKYELENAFDDLIEEDDASSANSSSNFPSSTLSQPNNSMKQSDEVLQNFEADQNRYVPKCTTNVQEAGDNEPLHGHLPNDYDNVFNPLRFRNLGMGDMNPVPLKDGLFSYDNPYQQTKRDFNGGHCPMMNGHNFGNDVQQDYKNLLAMYQQVLAELEEMRMAQKSAVGRLAIANNEREQSELSLKQAHELLVESKRRVLQMEEELRSQRTIRLELELRSEEQSVELAAAAASLADSQHRLQVAKLSHAPQANLDHLFKAQQERHKEEIDRLHEDLEKTRSRLVDKNKEVLEAERRAKESEREKEDLLIDKGATINRLAVELEQAQIQLSQLRQERNTARKQVKQLGSKLESTALELSAAREERLLVESALDGTLAAANTSASMVTSTPAAAKDKVNIVKMELVKSLNCLRQKEEQTNKLGQTIRDMEQQAQQQNKTLEEMNAEMDKLRSNEVKHSNEVKILQHQLELFRSNNRSELLQGLKLRNDQLEEDIVNLKKELKTVQLQHCEVEMELGKLKTEKSRRKSLEKDANSNLVTELDMLTSQLGESRKEAEHFRALYIEMCAAKEQMLTEMIKLRNSDAYRQLEEESEKVEELRGKLNDEKEKVDKLKDTIHDLRDKISSTHANTVGTQSSVERTDSPSQTEAEVERSVANAGAQTDAGHKEEKASVNLDKALIIENLKRDLSSKNKIIEDMQIKMAFQMEKNKLVGELHSKAKQFEAYIIQHYVRLADKRDASVEANLDADELQNRKHAATNTDTLEEFLLDHNGKSAEELKSEHEIRQEIAAQFAVELKALDTLYKSKLASAEQQNRDNFMQLRQLVEAKASEVRSLETLVLAERNQAKEMLRSKEDLLAKNDKENNALSMEIQSLKNNISNFDRVKEEVERSKSKLDKLRKELTEKKKQLIHEKDKVSKIEHELRLLRAQKTENQNNDKQLEVLREKYKSVKKMALNYKEYANEKDRHVKSELDRIKANYESAVNRLQAKLDAVITTKEEQVNQRMYDMESDFEQKLAEFNDIR